MMCEERVRTRTPLPPDEGLSTPGPSSSVGRLGGKNGLLGSARRDRLISTPGAHDKPAELFRKDLISAMKLADSEHLEEKEYLILQDPWREEWEKGVQVPVSLDAIPDLDVRFVEENKLLHGMYGFKLPLKGKYLHSVKDDNYKQAIHELHESQKLAEETCRYDLDDFDVSWLELVNEERDGMGEQQIQEWVMEQVMEGLENQCYNNMQNMIKTVEGLGIEYDEDIVCDVCRSPEGEENNEMVFCDSCDICVHQACYGVTSIPEGSWLCRACATGVTPKCILCPKMGGALKSTKSGNKWTHVACALWIPEVNFYNPEKMEPITNISLIPASRWSLVCSICREKSGACIQCSVKSCKTAFHVTCAFSATLDMKTAFHEESDQVQLKAYCMKHTKTRDGDNTPKKSDSPRKELVTPKKESEMTEEEKTQARSEKLEKLAEEFYTCVTSEEVATLLKLDKNLVDYICAYWILKRKANFNKPLMTPKTEEADMLAKQRDDSLIARMKMFIHLRQDLERVRNLCYMVSRREKISKQLQSLKRDVFFKQVQVIDEDPNGRINKREMSTIIQSHIAKNSIYDLHDKIIEASTAIEKQVTEEKKRLQKEEINQPPIKVRIKLQSQRQKPEVQLITGEEVQPSKLLKKLTDHSNVNKKDNSRANSRRSSSGVLEDTSTDIDVLNVIGEGDLKPDLLEVRSNVKEEVLESAASSDLPLPIGGSSNLKVKDQNKLTPKKLIERTAQKDHVSGGQVKAGFERDRKGEEHVFRRSQLIVSSDIKDKVHSVLQLSKERRAKINGLCYHAQAKIDRYLKHQKENHLIVSPIVSPRPNNNSSTTNKISSQNNKHISHLSDGESPMLHHDNSIARETRSVRRQIESDMDSDINDSVIYEHVDGEVSLRSSRDTTPIRSLDSSVSPGKQSSRKRQSSVSRLVTEKLMRGKNRRLDSENESGQEADSESEICGSEDLAHSSHHRRSSRRHSRRFEHVDEDSSQSTLSANSRQSTSRSKIAENWVATFIS